MTASVGERAVDPCESTRSSRAPAIIALLLTAYVLAFAQRQLPALLATPIAASFDVGDAIIGALHGSSFGLVYAVSALVAGALTDRVSRVRLLTGGLALAAIGTGLSASASSIEALVLCRILVAVGQAALVPVAYSVLGDVVGGKRLGIAVAAFAVAPFVGAGLLAMSVGALQDALDWRAPFAAVAGVSGLVALFVSRMREPPRLTVQRNGSSEALCHVRTHWASIGPVLANMILTATAGHLLLAWGVVWLARSHELSMLAASTSFGLALLCGGVAGTLAGGAAGDWMVARSRPRLLVLSLAAIVAAILSVAAFAAVDATAASWLLGGCLFFLAAAHATGPAALQEMTPSSLRGRQHGLAVLLVNILGLGTAPFLLGLASDILGARSAIGQALSVAVPTLLALSAVVAAVAARSQRQSAQAIAPARPSSTAKRRSDEQLLVGSRRS